MKTTIDKTIMVLEKLTPKYTNLSTKLNEVILSEEENFTLNIKLDQILALVNGNSSGDSEPDAISDLVALGILPKQVSEFTDADIGTIISIPYTDESGEIILNNGCIEFEVVGVNHHTNSEHQQTITLMTKNIICDVVYDAKEPNNPNSDRQISGNNRWSVSNIRQWLNSSGAANSWFTAQHEYDEAPTADKGYDRISSYADKPGFLAGFNTDILQHFTDITNTTAVPVADGGGSETTVDKVFLASYTEMFGLNNNEIAEGVHLARKFIDDNSRVKSGSNNFYYWMRSPVVSNARFVRLIDADVEDQYISAHDTDTGIAPVIVLC